PISTTRNATSARNAERVATSARARASGATTSSATVGTRWSRSPRTRRRSPRLLKASGRHARVLMVGGVPARLTECATLWHGHWFEQVPHRYGSFVDDSRAEPDGLPIVDEAGLRAFADEARRFDLVFCESPE